MCIRDSQGGAAEQIGMEQEGMALYPEIFPVVIIAQHLAGRYAVSYTHLDVYKRQRQAHAQNGARTHPAAQKIGGRH